MRFTYRVALTVLAATTAAAASAADKAVEDLLSKMRKAYDKVSSVTYVTESHFGTTLYINTFSYKKPSMIALEITSKDSSDFKNSLIKTSDGKDIAMKLPQSTDFSHEAFSMDKYEANLPVNLESFCFWDADRQLSTQPGMNMEHSSLKVLPNQDWNGRQWTVLEETAPEQKVVCHYFVDPKSHFIWRTVVRPIGEDKDYADCQITKLDFAAKISDSAFSH